MTLKCPPVDIQKTSATYLEVPLHLKGHACLGEIQQKNLQE